MVGGIAFGVDKVKAKRAARKASQTGPTDDHPAEGSSKIVQSSSRKSKNRRSSISKSQLQSRNSSSDSVVSISHDPKSSHSPPDYHDPPHHHQQDDAAADPPPYEAPPYERVVPAEQLERQATSEDAESSRKANERAIKEARDKRYKEHFSFKNGNFWGLVGVGLASMYGSGYSDKKQFRYWNDGQEEEAAEPKPHQKGAFNVV
ncbi:MAG: hypothetical protein M1828_005082 [Chrysothrix sp. TS-e1954]|nr:MAG: hypothetical protein M1828_005082 [Chrysothrix sp. TS-e1954]